MDMSDLDRMIDFALASAQVETGEDPAFIAHYHPSMLPAIACRAAPRPAHRRRRRPWSLDEDDYLRRNLGFLTESQIARHLDRSTDGVHIRAERYLRLPRPSKDPRYLTANQVARVLGVDNHKPPSWIKRGILRGEVIPSDRGRVIHRVHKTAFLAWACSPKNWIWFNPDRVRDPRLRRLIELRKARWGDEWWSVNRVAAYHGVTNQDVERYIRLGLIHAVKAPRLDGRPNGPGRSAPDCPRWSYGFILRSEAVRPGLVFIKKGKGLTWHKLHYWSPRADAFILLAAAIGLPDTAIARLSGYPVKKAAYRRRTLIASGQAAEIIETFRLPIQYRPAYPDAPAAVFADWFLHRRRFPCLRRAMCRFAALLQNHPSDVAFGRTAADLYIVRGVLAVWAAWHAHTPEERRMAGRMATGSNLTPGSLVRRYWTLRAWGLDPVDPGLLDALSD